jgi:hypothetical protein
LLGERVILLEDPNGVCELIASTIALCEGGDFDSVIKDLEEAGTASGTTKAVTKALVPVCRTTGDKAMVLAVPNSGVTSGLETL